MAGLADEVGLVLTGGGARGAYESGVLTYLHERVAPAVGVERLFDLYAGTSAGALNACAMAAGADAPAEMARHLQAYWRSIHLGRIFNFGMREVAQLPELFFGRGRRMARRWLDMGPPLRHAPHPPVAGVFDTQPLAQDMARLVPWEALQGHLQGGLVKGVALCVTELCTSKSVVFHQMAPGHAFAGYANQGREARAVRLGAAHALASSAIPFLFPAVQVDGICYVDGALRQNTPLNPVLRMGARKVVIVGLSRDAASRHRSARMGCRLNPMPGSLFLLGRTVNALSEGTLDYELSRLEMINSLLRSGCARYGDEFSELFNRAASPFRAASFREVQTLTLRPSVSLDRLAFEAVQEAPGEVRMPGAPGRLVGAMLRSEAVLDSGLASFLLFTPTFVDKCMDLGYQDAQRQHHALVAFFQAPAAGQG